MLYFQDGAHDVRPPLAVAYASSSAVCPLAHCMARCIRATVFGPYYIRTCWLSIVRKTAVISYLCDNNFSYWGSFCGSCKGSGVREWTNFPGFLSPWDIDSKWRAIYQAVSSVRRQTMKTCMYMKEKITASKCRLTGQATNSRYSQWGACFDEITFCRRTWRAKH